VPRFPRRNSDLAAVGGSVFSALARRLAEYPGEVYPLHVGDTWMAPAEGCRMEDLSENDHPGMHRYASPQGMPRLLEALAARAADRTGVSTEPRQLLVAAGATGALGAAVGALTEPGDEVLLVAPYWPLIAGIVRSYHAVPVAVPLLGTAESAGDATERLVRRTTPRTVALYLNTPNNPTGKVLPRAWLEALVEHARRHDLWLLADEVYEDYLYRGEHTYCRTLAPERTLSVHSFSKAYGMAGNRCGWVAGPKEAMADLQKVSVHTFYSTPTASQLAALKVLGVAGDDWIATARERYRELGEWTAGRLGVPPPDGSTFLFLDVSEHLDDRGLTGFLERCADRGLFLAPGLSFGPYPEHVRVCFTSAEPPVVARGVEVLGELLGRKDGDVLIGNP
jgi:aspartate/methionine/tyrosine aminotransferase